MARPTKVDTARETLEMEGWCVLTETEARKLLMLSVASLPDKGAREVLATLAGTDSVSLALRTALEHMP